MKLISEDDSLVILIDIQEKLVNAAEDKYCAVKAAKLVKAAGTLNIPVIVSEQYPKGLGKTVPEIYDSLPKNTFIQEKTSFSLLNEEGFMDRLKSYGRKQIILCGIETHICVYQTATDLINAGFNVTIVKDACSSRNKYECDCGIEKIKSAGAQISCLEIILFELLKGAKHPKFKEIQSLIK